MSKWPKDLNTVQVRIARPTNNLKDLIRFYVDGLGLEVIDSFEDHDGYSGVMVGLPDESYHLEFTEFREPVLCSPPSKDNLLVFYMPNLKEVLAKVEHMRVLGFECTEPENPYWTDKGYTLEDPDGWRVVLMNTKGI